MSWIDQLEKKAGRLALPNLMRVIAGFQGLVFVLSLSMRSLLERLLLYRDGLLEGEVWRAVTFLIVPPGSGVITTVFSCLILVWLGDMLEQAWGAFRLNLYVLAVMISTNLFVLALNAFPPPGLLGLQLIILAALVHPNQIIQLYFVIPVKLKYVAMLDAAFTGFLLMSYGSKPGGLFFQLGILAQLVPMLAIVLPALFKTMRDQSKVTARREKFQTEQEPEGETFHRCHACGTTEKSRPQAEFRVSAVDHEEYCEQCRPSVETAPAAVSPPVDPPALTEKPWSGSLPLP